MNDKWRSNEDPDAEVAELLDSLPRGKEPSPELEEELVARLRREGVIRDADEQHRPWRRAIGLAAAALVIFAVGMAAGRATVSLNMGPDTSTERLGLAARIQGTGTEYVHALASLVEDSGSLEEQERRQAEEVAFTAFYAAASELLRIAPDELMTAFAIASFDPIEPSSLPQPQRPQGNN